MKWDAKFAEILSEVEQPDFCTSRSSFHDVGKGQAETDHVRGSLQVMEGVATRLRLSGDDRETVEFLIGRHLEMSAAFQRRDVFDAETVHEFASVVGSPERLKMLCLVTYADIRAVNPEALTPWKAELLWQLYAATANHLTRSVDDERVRITGPTREIESLLAIMGSPASADDFRFSKAFRNAI